MAELLQWWNLVYVLAFFFALLYVLLNAIGLASGGGADADLEVDADLDVDVDLAAEADLDVDADLGVDLDAETELDLGAELEADADLDAGVEAEPQVYVHPSQVEPGVFEQALSFFGIGRVPLSIILMTFLITFAIVGWAINTVLEGVLWTPGAFFPISFAGAVLCGLTVTKALAGTLGRFLKPVETAAVARSALVGRIGTASLPVTEEFGTALVRDPYGSLHKVVCKVPQGVRPIPKGQTVLLVRYVRENLPQRRPSGYYLVETYEAPES